MRPCRVDVHRQVSLGLWLWGKKELGPAGADTERGEVASVSKVTLLLQL